MRNLRMRALFQIKSVASLGFATSNGDGVICHWKTGELTGNQNHAKQISAIRKEGTVLGRSLLKLAFLF